MSDVSIRVEHISKRYSLGEREPYKSLRDVLARAASAPLGWLRRQNGASFNHVPADFWALDDVSFEIRQGEAVGIIGRNGAGKSTLLKILSRITKPTRGRAELHGRVGSLLEVGTGFHPELTGRENVFLNGAILGMKRQEIERKFDEIVAFAEIEKFLDTPVKRYSSGMYVRLAFAVAAHLEPEILLVDEVLAVGDAEFQKKCLGKMGEVAKEGRTVLFVSHSMAAIERLCDVSILLDTGKIRCLGPSAQVVQIYLQGGQQTTLVWERTSTATEDAYLQKVYVSDEQGDALNYLTTATDVTIVINLCIKRPMSTLRLSFGLLDRAGQQIFGSTPGDCGEMSPTEAGEYRAMVHLPSEILMPGYYGIRVTLWLPNGGVLDSVDGMQFLVHEGVSLATSTPGGRVGLIAIRCDWDVIKTSKKIQV